MMRNSTRQKNIFIILVPSLVGSERYHAIIIGLVITAKFTANAGWIATAVWTLESYPTVIRYFCFHYENTPIQIYRKFHHQKLKIFR